MATSISKATPRSDHVCVNADRLVGRLNVPTGWPLFPAMDRWGNVASDPVPAMSVPGMETVLRDVAGQRWAHATVRVPAPVDEKKKTSHREPAPTVVTPKEPLVTRTATRDGVAARAEARASLAGVADRLDELDAAIDDLNDQVAQLMADHTDPA